MSDDHEQAWAEALAAEHADQRELLATLRDELGAFARECAAALTALDAYAGVAGVTQVLNAARTGYQHAALVLDVGRRLPGLSRTTALDDVELVGLYAQLGGDEDIQPRLVRHAGELLRAGPKRTDRELLQAVVSSSGVRAQLEEVIGPAPITALAALRPLARWVPALARLQRGEGRGRALIDFAGNDLTEVLRATAELGVGSAAVASDAVAVADSLRDTVEHVSAAARAVEDGKLKQVLAEARRKLEADLDKLRVVYVGAEAAPPEWRDARRREHAALTEEVREKLEQVERTRRMLGALLPQLQVITRALATVERLQAIESRLDPQSAAGVEAARMSLLLGLGDLWEGIVSHEPGVSSRRPQVRARWLVAAVVVVVGAVLAFVLSSNGSNKHAAAVVSVPAVTSTAAATTTLAATTTVAAVTTASPPNQPPRLSPVKAVFDPAQRATFYSVAVRDPGQGAKTYSWRLSPPKGNPGCNKFAPVPGAPNQAVWHHADTDGCTHIGVQHAGTVLVTVTTRDWICTQSFFGTLTSTGSSAQKCHRH